MTIDLLTFLPGYCQGLSKCFTTYPFDVIKIKMQTNQYKSTINCARNLIKTDPKIFFRGFSISLLTFPIDRAISYKIYDDLNKQQFNPYLSAFFGGIASSIISVPTQFITTNAIHMKKDQYQGVRNLIKNKIKTKHNFYRGYWLDTTRAICGSTLFLGTYGNIKNKFPDTKIYTIFSAISAITVTWCVTFPLDAVRAEQQVSKDISIYNLLKNRYYKYGLLNIYNGLTPVLLRSIPSTSIGMLVYEYVKKLVN